MMSFLFGSPARDPQPKPVMTMKVADRNAPRPRVHRHVLERVAALLAVPQQACARRASKALREAVTAASMEDMLRATVLEHRDTSAGDAQLVVVAMSRALGPFPSADALVAWCGRAATPVRRSATALPARCCNWGLCATDRYSPLPIFEWVCCDDSVRRDCCCVRPFNARR